MIRTIFLAQLAPHLLWFCVPSYVAISQSPNAITATVQVTADAQTMRRSTSFNIKNDMHDAGTYQQLGDSDIKLHAVGEPRIWDSVAEIGLWVPLAEWLPPSAEATPWWWGQETSQDVKVSAKRGPDAKIQSLRIFHDESQNSSSFTETKARASHQLHAARKRRPEMAARFMIWVPQVIWTNSTRDYAHTEMSEVLARSDGNQNTILASSTEEISIENPLQAVKSTSPTEYLAALAQDIPLIDYFRTFTGANAVHEGVVEFAPKLDDGRLTGFDVTQRNSPGGSSKNVKGSTATIPRTPRSLAERELYMSHAHMACDHANPEQARKRGWCMAPNSEARHEAVTVRTQSGQGDRDAVEVSLTHGKPLESGSGSSETGLGESQTMVSPNYATELGMRTVLSSCVRKDHKDVRQFSSDAAGVKLHAKRSGDGNSFDMYNFAFTDSGVDADKLSSQMCSYSKPEVLAQQGVWVPLAQYTTRAQEVAAEPSPSHTGGTAPRKHWKTQAQFDSEGRLVRFSMHAEREPPMVPSTASRNMDYVAVATVVIVVLVICVIVGRKRMAAAQSQRNAA